MNDEIREIVKEIECYRNEELCLIFLSRKESNALLDYINNLQQENERLKENNGNMQEEMSRVWEENERLKETLEEHDETLEKTFNLVAQLTLRIDKAVEYINNTIEDKPLTDFDCGSNNACNDLLNILQNGSDKQ